jgi:hypothetical protein
MVRRNTKRARVGFSRVYFGSWDVGWRSTSPAQKPEASTEHEPNNPQCAPPGTAVLKLRRKQSQYYWEVDQSRPSRPVNIAPGLYWVIEKIEGEGGGGTQLELRATVERPSRPKSLPMLLRRSINK